MDRAKPCYMDPEIDSYWKKPYRGSVHTAEHGIGMKEWTTHGVMGDPRGGSAETGERLCGISAEWLTQVIPHEFSN